MRGLRPGTVLGAAVLLGVLAGGLVGRAGAQAAPRPTKSVYGTLEIVDQSASGVIMKTDDGRRVAWKFDKSLVARLAKFKPGDKVIVIYRERGADKAVTAIAFPGAAATPVYHNTSGQRVELVGGPLVGGACGEAPKDPVSITSIANGSQGEVTQACWCCAPSGGMCIPANRTGNGEAFLVNCYE